MLRLPPGLRRLVAINIFRSHPGSGARNSGGIISGSLGHVWRDLDDCLARKPRHYATTSPDQRNEHSAQNAGQALPSTYRLSEHAEGTKRQKTVAAIVGGLENDHCQIDDSLYDELERDLLLAVLFKAAAQSPTSTGRHQARRRIHAARNAECPLGALRWLAVEEKRIPELVRKKAFQRFEETEVAIPTDAGFGLFDVPHILEHLPMPTAAALPEAPSGLFSASGAQQAISETCETRGFDLKHSTRWTEKRLPVEQELYGREMYHTCHLSVRVAGLCTGNAHGDAPEKEFAEQAAWLHLVSKLHVAGTLRKLFAAREIHRGSEVTLRKGTQTFPSQDAPAPMAEKSPFFDITHVRRTYILPSKEQYPNALEDLFDPSRAAMAIHNVCAQAKLPMESEASYTQREIPADRLQDRPAGMGETHCYKCTLKVGIENVGQQVAEGDGFSKIDARRAAWIHVLSKLHVSGALAEIFKPAEIDTTRTPAESSAPKDAADEATVEQDIGMKGDFEENADETDETDETDAYELADVNTRALEEEKDATVEIYNYAARFGFVPVFETSLVQPRKARARLGRTPKKPAPVTQVHIKVEALSIDVMVTGADPHTAEVAAALAFKKQAEEKHLRGAQNEPKEAFRVLSTDTAKQFLDFCKENGVQMSLEMELEAGHTNTASVTAGGRQIGQTVTLRTRRDAQAVAYLTAALEVANEHSHLLPEFEKALERGNGKVLKAVDPVGLPVEAGVSQIMRDALVEAHASGLPTSREALAAETIDAEDDISRRLPALDNAEIVKTRMRLLDDQKRLDVDPEFQPLREQKAALPMTQYRSELLEMINKNSYSIVVGATGSGKTTQVPQIIFEDAIRRYEGPYCNVICTQPRRIAATSVAQRVAEERNVPLRKTVGYHVRFDARPPYKPYGITYCTTGILLEKLKYDPDGILDATSHVLIDEVHERDIYIDFLMIVLKKAIQARVAAGKKVPKVVLMSATLDTELFANYFKQPWADSNTRRAPCLSVPGRTFPVKERYLGSIMDELFRQHGKSASELIEADSGSQDFLQAETEFSSTRSGENQSKRESVIDWKRDRVSEDGISAKEEKEEAIVPIGLLSATIAHICATTSDDGAILAFLPGLEEITKTQRLLLGRQIFGVDFGDPSKFKICLLHSTLPKEQQLEIFEPSPPGCRKIILSTNLAETSVTVADVKYVVDTGKLREKRYDQLRRITKLQCVWESKSNSKQRMGRAGRVQDGFYYALFSKERADSMRAIGLPELLRSDLQETCLSIKAQKYKEPVAAFLAQAIEPPSDRAVEAAIKDLKAVEAYTADEELTALGRVLSSLPVHPALGKMIILGVIFKCLDPMIILGAAAEERPLFVVPLSQRAEAAKVHSAYNGKSQSDHLGELEAFKELRQLKSDQGMPAIQMHGREKFLHVGAFRNIDQTAHQIVQILQDAGLIHHEVISDGPAYGPAALNTNANNSALIKCLLLAGAHPNLAVKLTDRWPVFRSPTESNVLMHPRSVNKEGRPVKGKDPVFPRSTLFTYSTLTRSNDGANLFLRGTTKVDPLMAVLFGGQLRVPEPGLLEMDGWMPFEVAGAGNEEKEYKTKLVLEFRKALERVLHRAYASLSDKGREGRRGFGEDAVRDRFAERVVQVIGSGAGDGGLDGWTDGWGGS